MRKEAFDGVKNSVIMKSVQVDEDEREGEPLGTVYVYTPGKTCLLKFRSVPLPSSIVEFLLKHVEVIKKITDNTIVDAQPFWTSFTQVCENVPNEERMDVEWKEIVHKIISFGPKRIGANILAWDLPSYIGKT